MVETKKIGINYFKLIGGLLGIICAVLISRAHPPAGLNFNSMMFLGTFVCAVIWWVVDLFPDYVTGLLMVLSWVILKVVPFATAFGAFSGENVWILIGALGMGVGAAESGLLGRIAMWVMSKFPATFKGMTTAMYVAGAVITPLIPSVTAKVAILAPFSKAVGDKMGFENESEGMGGLFAAMFASGGVLYPAFLSGSFLCYTVVGLMPKDVAAKITWMSWFSMTWVWFLVVLIVSYFALQMLYKPKTVIEMDPNFVKNELAALGSMSRYEKVVALVIAGALLMWITERVHGISAAQVAIAALLLMLIFKVFERAKFKAGIGWDSIMFIGSILCLASVFPVVKADQWIAGMAGHYVSPLLSNMYVFVIVFSLMIYALRFAVPSMTATIGIFTIFFVPLATAAHINPLIPGFLLLAATNLWVVPYQSTTFLTALYASRGMVKHRQLIKLSLAYMTINIIAMLASVPLWKLIGFIK